MNVRPQSDYTWVLSSQMPGARDASSPCSSCMPARAGLISDIRIDVYICADSSDLHDRGDNIQYRCTAFALFDLLSSGICTATCFRGFHVDFLVHFLSTELQPAGLKCTFMNPDQS